MAKLTRKSMNNNAVKGNKASRYEVAVDSRTIDNKVNNAFSDYQVLVDNGTISRETLMGMKAVDMSNCVRPISVLQLNYNPVNLIGPATTAMTNVTIIDVEEDMEAFKSMFVDLEPRDKHVKWTTIWKEGYNMFRKFDLVTGQHFTIYVVTNEEIKAFAKQVKLLDVDSLTVAEALQMQFDFRPLVRAWQESYIDVVKDKTKKFDLDYTDVINSVAVKTTFIKKHKDAISFNFDAVKAAKRARKNVPEFKFSLEVEVNDTMKIYEEQPTDKLSKLNDTIIDATETFLNGSMHRAYVASDDADTLAKFEDAAAQNKELAFFIKRVYNMLNNSFYQDDAEVSKEEYAMLRNVIYSKASELQVEAKDVITVAMSVAMSNVFYSEKEKAIKVTVDKERFSDAHVKNIFPNEFAVAVSEAMINEEINLTDELVIADLLVELNRDIQDGETIEFVNGAAVDGSIVLDTDYTGFATECDGNFVYDVNIYAYDFVESIMLDETFKANTKAKDVKAATVNKAMDSIRDKGEAFNHAINEAAITHIKIAGVNNNVVVNAVNNDVIGRLKTASNLAGDKVVADIMTFKAKNNYQQLFLIIFE